MAKGCFGDKLSGRVGKSLLRALGVDDMLVAGDLKDYEDIAVRVKEDNKFLRQVKERMSEGRGESGVAEELFFFFAHCFAIYVSLSLSLSVDNLFDTSAWVKAWERAVLTITSEDGRGHKHDLFLK